MATRKPNLNTLILDGETEANRQTLRDYDRKLAMLDLLILQAEQSGDVAEFQARAAEVLR